jgi:hypothetical protein
MLRYLIALLLISNLSFAGEVWLFLKDGRVCLAAPNATDGKLPDGSPVTFTKEEIQGQRTREQLDQAVDAMIAEVGQAKNLEAHAARFRVFKGAAVPRLLHHLESAAAVNRLSALYALQFCWSPQAVEPVTKLLADSDHDVFKGALAAVANNMPPATLLQHLKERSDDKDLVIASIVFEFVEKYQTDPALKRLERILADANARASALPILSHYFSPELTPLTLPLLAATPVAEKRAGLVALIQQTADGTDVRKRVLLLLGSSDPEIRELAAEYFVWLGRTEDLDALRSARKTELDVYARAALDGALNVIAQRDALRAKLPDGKTAVVSKSDSDESSRQTYLDFLAAFSATPNRGDADAALAFYKTADVHEPFSPFAVPATQDPGSRYRLRALLAQRLFAAPCGALDDATQTDFRGERESPAAAKLVPPIREYLDPKRKSYGLFMQPNTGLFENSVHVGDDCGWHKEYRTVVAIAPGVVRLVAHIFTWGHIVVLEHTGADGKKFCSLYGHLSPMLLVRPGDIVEAGQKIGCIGRSNSVDNGGYGAHVHFGIHKGPYSTETRWVCGYVDPTVFSSGQHGWTDPQAFLQGS